MSFGFVKSNCSFHQQPDLKKEQNTTSTPIQEVSKQVYEDLFKTVSDIFLSKKKCSSGGLIYFFYANKILTVRFPEFIATKKEKEKLKNILREFFLKFFFLILFKPNGWNNALRQLRFPVLTCSSTRSFDMEFQLSEIMNLTSLLI